MPKFERGQTSKSILDKKHAITKSILLKAQLIGLIKTHDNIPSTLVLKSRTISEGAVHEWHDDYLGIIAYSRNTAYAKHNESALKTLQSAIKAANKAITQSESATQDHAPPPTDNDVKTIELRAENETLKSALTEVYRAYMQLLDKDREDKQIDDTYRKMIRDQAQVLGKHRLQTVK